MNIEPATLRVYSVNVIGRLQSASYAGGSVTTGFFKTALQGQAYANRFCLRGNTQADLGVHGGPEKPCFASGLRK